MRFRFWIGAVAVLSLVSVACGQSTGSRLPAVEAADGGGQSSLPDGAALVADNSLVVGSQTYKLGATAGAPVIGALAPLAVASPDGKQYLYNSWAQGADQVCSGDPAERGNCKQPGPGAVYGRPTLRVFTLSSGNDSVLEVGAVSAAWRSDGAIGYFKGRTSDVPADAARFVGHLYVRPSAGSAPVQWTNDVGRYVAVAWAGSTLVAYRQFEGERFDVLALSRPGSVRTLATNATVVSVSPDGSQVLVNRDSGGTSTLNVIDVSAGETVSALDLGTTKDPESGATLAWATYGGSWDGDLVAAESSAGVGLFRVSSGKIRFERLLLRKNSEYGMGIHEPHLFREKSGKLGLVAWAPLDAPSKNGRVHAVLTCDVSAKSCKKNSTRSERSVGIARRNAHGRSR